MGTAFLTNVLTTIITAGILNITVGMFGVIIKKHVYYINNINTLVEYIQE
jgi:hypothetical protein